MIHGISVINSIYTIRNIHKPENQLYHIWELLKDAFWRVKTKIIICLKTMQIGKTVYLTKTSYFDRGIILVSIVLVNTKVLKLKIQNKK